jgi:hypothetical protein
MCEYISVNKSRFSLCTLYVQVVNAQALTVMHDILKYATSQSRTYLSGSVYVVSGSACDVHECHSMLCVLFAAWHAVWLSTNHRSIRTNVKTFFCITNCGVYFACM